MSYSTLEIKSITCHNKSKQISWWLQQICGLRITIDAYIQYWYFKTNAYLWTTCGRIFYWYYYGKITNRYERIWQNDNNCLSSIDTIQLHFFQHLRSTYQLIYLLSIWRIYISIWNLITGIPIWMTTSYLIGFGIIINTVIAHCTFTLQNYVQTFIDVNVQLHVYKDCILRSSWRGTPLWHTKTSNDKEGQVNRSLSGLSL